MSLIRYIECHTNGIRSGQNTFIVEFIQINVYTYTNESYAGAEHRKKYDNTCGLVIVFDA